MSAVGNLFNIHADRDGTQDGRVNIRAPVRAFAAISALAPRANAIGLVSNLFNHLGGVFLDNN
jgi:hypothetical protein